MFRICEKLSLVEGKVKICIYVLSGRICTVLAGLYRAYAEICVCEKYCTRNSCV